MTTRVPGHKGAPKDPHQQDQSEESADRLVEPIHWCIGYFLSIYF